MITQQIKLNLIPGQVFPRVNASQYDSGTRTLQMALYNGDQVFNIASGMTAVVQGTKPDKTGFQYAATITEGSNIATLDITQQMTAVKGDVICELVISNGNNRIATVNFILYVEAAALAGDTVISETDLPLIEEAAELAQTIGPIAQQVNEDAQTASNAATRAEDAAEAAETWSSNAPYIGANDHWYVYNSAIEQFVDTGVSAEGQTGPQGPSGPSGPAGPAGSQGPTGETGNGIESITKTSTVGLVDTYTILFTDGTSTTFTVTNGQDGQGSGDMTKAVYDAQNVVADAGGIVAYVQAHSGAGTLAGLTDVALSTLATGQTLVYNATTHKWENGQISYANISGKPTLGSAAAKNSTDTLSSGSTDLIESGAVHSAIQTLTNQDSAMLNILGAKNVLPNTATTQVINGVTFTVNSDGSVTCSGTATADTWFKINDLVPITWPDNTYMLSKCPGVYTWGSVQVQLYDSSNTYLRAYYATPNEDTLIVSSSDAKYIATFIVVTNGKTINTTVYPMVRPASIKDDTYVPYTMTNKELTTALNDYCKVTLASGSITIDAGAQNSATLTFTPPSGYKAILASPYSAMSWAWCWCECVLQSNNIVRVVIKNTNTIQETQTVYAYVLCIRV